MSFNVIFILVFLIVLGLTALALNFLNHFFSGLSERLTRIRPGGISAENPGKIKFRHRLTVAFNTFLLLVLGLLSLVICLGGTMLDPNFVEAELQKLDITAVATDLLNPQSSNPLLGQVGEASSELNEVADLSSIDQLYRAESVEATVRQLEPVLRQKMSAAVYGFYDYFQGKSTGLDVVVTLDDVKLALRQNLLAAVAATPPPGLNSAPAQIETYAGSLYDSQFARIPPQLELTLKSSKSYVTAPLGEIRWVVTRLSEIRHVLIALIFVLAAAIIVVHRDLKTALWMLGITLAVSAAADYLYAVLAKEAGLHLQALAALPSLNVWLIRVATDVLANIKQPVIILVKVGGALLALSLVLLLINRLKRIGKPKSRQVKP